MLEMSTPHRSGFARVRDFVDFFGASSPARFAITVFTALILAMTAVLSLPIATASRTVTPLADAVFTAYATPETVVTGHDLITSGNSAAIERFASQQG